MITLWFLIGLITIIALAFIIIPLLAPVSNVSNTQSYFLALFLALIVTITAIIFYFYQGSSRQFDQWLTAQQKAQQVQKEIAKFGSRQQIIVALQQKLIHLPQDKNSAKGWYLLGKLYFNDKKLPAALSAFQKAVNLDNQPDYILQLVSVKYLLNHNHLANTDQQQLKTLLLKAPDNVNAINLLALDAYQQKNYVMAIHYWQSLLKYFATQSQDRQILVQMIQEAQQQLPANTVITPEINVNIKITEALKHKLTSTDILFVYATSPHSKMPLAVMRLAAMSLPIVVTLDNRHSMLPGQTLMPATTVTVTARVSKTGNAMLQAGDLIANSKSIILKSHYNTLEININKIKS